MKKALAIEIFGSQVKLSKALGISQPAVARWDEDVPPLRVYQIKETSEYKRWSRRNRK